MQAMAETPPAPWREETFATRLAPPHFQGQIRTTPEDFVVTETLPVEPGAGGEHLYLYVTKVRANTGWVAEQLAAFAGVSRQDVGYAGRKDRHAVVHQWFSIYLPGSAEPDWADFHAEGVTIEKICRDQRKLRPGDLAYNQFHISVRYAAARGAALEDVAQRLDQIQQEGFPNYFGYQRFGRDLHNLERADNLLRLRQRQGGDRGMLMSAARGWLFNIGLSDCLAAGDSRASGPLFGKSRDPQPGEEALCEVYAGWVAGLRRLGAKVGERPLIVLPVNLTWEINETVTHLSFRLPAGSYATSLLREVFVVEDLAA